MNIDIEGIVRTTLVAARAHLDRLGVSPSQVRIRSRFSDAELRVVINLENANTRKEGQS